MQDEIYIFQTKLVIFPIIPQLKTVILKNMYKNTVGGTIKKCMEAGNKKIIINVEGPETNIWNFIYEMQRLSPSVEITGENVVQTEKLFKFESFSIKILKTEKDLHSKNSSGENSLILNQECSFYQKPNKDFAKKIYENMRKYSPGFVEFAKAFALKHFEKRLESISDSSQRNNEDMEKLLKKLEESQKEVQEEIKKSQEEIWKEVKEVHELIKNQSGTSKMVSFEWYHFFFNLIFINRKYGGEKVCLAGSWDNWKKPIQMIKIKLVLF